MPQAEGLETRQLLSSLATLPSANVTGIDSKGNRWTLTLYGPGTLNVVDSTGTAFTKANLNSHRDINTIIVSGTVTARSRLVGKVAPSAGSDGKVFFQRMSIEPTAAYAQLDPNLVRPNLTTPQNGIAAVDMPNFWLGHTDTAKPSATSPYHSGFLVAGSITASEGINALRFGGIDATYTPPGGTPLNQSGQNNEFVVQLGIPIYLGTSIIVDKVITDAQLSPATTSTGTDSVFQEAATFIVDGRLNLFQANEIRGNTSSVTSPTGKTLSAVPTQFLSAPPSTTSGVVPTTNLPGGTFVVSEAATVTGAIGFIRIGGNATNFATYVLANNVLASPIDTALDPKISNFFVGGETNNVQVISPGGTRNVYFGLGMDNVKLNTQFIQNLQANRGAVGSTVTVNRAIGNMVMGGDVVNTNIQSGYQQNLSSEIGVPAASSFSASGGSFNGEPVPTLMNRSASSLGNQVPLAHGGGAIHGRIAGNVVNSIISASVDPDPSALNDPGTFEKPSNVRFPFGAPENIVLPTGYINIKVEGSIDNSGLQSGSTPTVDPNLPPTAAFFAKNVIKERGPVIPPNVPSAPYKGPTTYHRGQYTLKGLYKIDNTFKNRAQNK